MVHATTSSRHLNDCFCAPLVNVSGLVGLRGDADQRHLLDVGAVGVAGLQPELLELVFEVVDRQLFALGSRRAAFVFVGRQHFDAVEDRLRLDLRQLRQRDLRRRCRRRRRGRTRCRLLGRSAAARGEKRLVRITTCRMTGCLILAFYRGTRTPTVCRDGPTLGLARLPAPLRNPYERDRDSYTIGTMAPIVLFSYAHPDDESFASAGLAMSCQARGVETVLVTATLGQKGKTGDPPVCRQEELGVYREAELRDAARIIGFNDMHLLRYEDRQLADAPLDEIRKTLVSLIRRYRPAIVVTFDPNGFNAHPDHVAISRFTMDAVSVTADPRWIPDAGGPHEVSRVLWIAPIPPWEAARSTDLQAQPGTDFVIDISAWRDRKAAALKSHRSQHLSTDRYFFSQPDVDRLLSLELFRHGWGPSLARRPSGDIFEGID